LGLVKSFVNSFLIFWGAFLYIMVMLDLRAIILKELPPFVTYHYSATLMLDSLSTMLSNKVTLENIIGLTALIFAALLMGFVSDSFFDSIFTPILFTIITIVLSIPFYQLIYYYSTTSGIPQEILSSRLSKGFLNMIIAIVFSIIGKSAVKEEKPIIMKEIES